MATTSSVASSAGLDVPMLVSQLMAIEHQPIDKLNAKIDTDQARISSFGTLMGLVSSFQTALQGLNNNLQGFSATSSDAGIFSASAASTAAAGIYALDISSLAQPQSLVAIGQTSSTAAIGTGAATTVTFDFGTIDISASNSHGGGSLSGGVYTNADYISNGSGTKSITIDGTNNTLQGIRDAINAAKMGVTATIVNDGSATPYRLVLTSDKSGISNSLKITTSGGDGSIDALLAYDPAGLPAAQHLNQTTAAQNANFTVNGITVTSTSNTISDAIQGVALTLNKVTTAPVNLTVARDTSAIKTAVSGFVDAYNALVTQLKSRSAYGGDGKTAPPLAGDGTIRLMLDQLHGIFNIGAGGTLTSLSQIGITTQKDGTLKLDSSQLSSAMSNNFSDVADLFSSGTGYATRLSAWSKAVLAPGGLIDTRTQSLRNTIKGYNDQIDKLEIRMATLRKRYTATYSNLNVLLSNMSSTSAYLSQQLTRM